MHLLTRKMSLEPVKMKNSKIGFQPGPNDTLSQNFMKLGLLVAEKNVNRATDRHTRFMFYKYRYFSLFMQTCLKISLQDVSVSVQVCCVKMLSKFWIILCVTNVCIFLKRNHGSLLPKILLYVQLIHRKEPFTTFFPRVDLHSMTI